MALSRSLRMNIATRALRAPRTSTVARSLSMPAPATKEVGFVFPRVKADVSSFWVLGVAGVSGAMGFAQYLFGTADNIFDHRFVTEADPDDLAEFYGNEDFMEIFSVFPFVVQLMMRGGYFDDQGHVHTYGFPGPLEVSMEFEEKEVDDQVVWFNKRERFQDHSFGITWWEITQNFGFNQRKDGKCEVYHHGENWTGPWFIRLVFHLHAMYVIRAAEYHINSKFFGSEEFEDEKLEQQKNIPLHVFQEYLGGLQDEIENKKKDLEKARLALKVKMASGVLDEADLAEIYDKKIEEHAATIEKLKAASIKRHITASMNVKTNIGPRRRTKLRLSVDDAETSQAIDAALGHLADEDTAAPATATNQGSQASLQRLLTGAVPVPTDELKAMKEQALATEMMGALKEVREQVLKSVAAGKVADDAAVLAALKAVEASISSDSGFMVGNAASLADAWAYIATQDLPPATLEGLPKLKAVVDKVSAPASSAVSKASISIGGSNAGLVTPSEDQPSLRP